MDRKKNNPQGVRRGQKSSSSKGVMGGQKSPSSKGVMGGQKSPSSKVRRPKNSPYTQKTPSTRSPRRKRKSKNPLDGRGKNSGIGNPVRIKSRLRTFLNKHVNILKPDERQWIQQDKFSRARFQQVLKRYSQSQHMESFYANDVPPKFSFFADEDLVDLIGPVGAKNQKLPVGSAVSYHSITTYIAPFFETKTKR